MRDRGAWLLRPCGTHTQAPHMTTWLSDRQPTCLACSSPFPPLLGGRRGVTCNGWRKAPPDPSGIRNVSGAAATRRRQIRASRKPLHSPLPPESQASSPLVSSQPPTQHASGYLRRLAASLPEHPPTSPALPTHQPMPTMTATRDTTRPAAAIRLDVDVDDLPPLLVMAPD